MNPVTISKNKLTYPRVTAVDRIGTREFYEHYVARSKPLIIRNYTREWEALNWDDDYFREKEMGLKLAVKVGEVAKGQREYMTISEYIARVEAYEEDLLKGNKPAKPGYLHDVPFFHLFPELVTDIEPFPVHLFPRWYREKWPDFIQFFMGTTGSLTPLHFDTLRTNNLFFQITGSKKFILIPEEQKEFCYIEGWRWAKYDPSNPDFEQFPLARKVKPLEAVLEPGDILFIPAGMLHQVHGLSASISFNIDWHTAASAFKGMKTLFKGAPLQNVYYNTLSFMGLGLKIPSRLLFPYYKSYLNYVS